MKLTTLILCTVITAANLAFADVKEEVQAHLTTAYTAYKEKRWQDVLDALEKAYALDPKPELHYSMGQVYVKMDRCPEAVLAYEKFLASNPKTDNADVAREAIKSCTAKAEPPKPKPEPKPEPPPPPPPRDTGTDVLGISLVAGGAVMLVAGGGLYMLARGDLDDAEGAPTYGKQDDLYQSARNKRLLSIVLTLGGVIATGAGVVHYVRKKPRDQRGLGLAPARAGGLVTWTAPF